MRFYRVMVASNEKCLCEINDAESFYRLFIINSESLFVYLWILDVDLFGAANWIIKQRKEDVGGLL
jgi:hypothetical protein